MAKQMIDTPNLDELEKGPWPSFVTGLKRLAKDNDMMVDLLGQLETIADTLEDPSHPMIEDFNPILSLL